MQLEVRLGLNCWEYVGVRGMALLGGVPVPAEVIRCVWWHADCFGEALIRMGRLGGVSTQGNTGLR